MSSLEQSRLDYKTKLAQQKYFEGYLAVISAMLDLSETRPGASLQQLLTAFNQFISTHEGSRKKALSPTTLATGSADCLSANLCFALMAELILDSSESGLTFFSARQIVNSRVISLHYHLAISGSEVTISDAETSYAKQRNFTKTESDEFIASFVLTPWTIAWLHWVDGAAFNSIGRDEEDRLKAVNAARVEIALVTNPQRALQRVISHPNNLLSTKRIEELSASDCIDEVLLRHQIKSNSPTTSAPSASSVVHSSD